ncbi:acyltransferase family protein [Xanthobacter sediminis]|uniref:acyltransferase family protein n=1 Tax=Xanthobacter sediminis TaxID=3119926 RepID=UPI00372B99B3
MRRVAEATFRPDLQALRGLACCAVLIGHGYVFTSTLKAEWPDSAGWQVGRFMVSGLLSAQPAVLLFLALSGYVLGCQLELSPARDARSLMAYYVRRAFRLLPLMLVSIVFAAALRALLMGPPLFLQGVFIPPEVPWLQTILLQDFRLNAVLWTLNVEIGASLLLPAFYLLASRGSAGLNILVALALVPLMWVQEPFFLQFLIFFYVGLLVPYLPRLSFVDRTPVVVLFALLSLAVIQWAPDVLAGEKRDWFFMRWQRWMWIEPLAVMALLYCIVHNRSALGALLERTFLRKIGDISFGIYLLHLPIMMGLLALAKHFGVTPDLASLGSAYGFFFVITGITFVLAVGLAVPAYRWCELPFIGMGRDLARRIGRRPVSAGALPYTEPSA